MKEETRTQLDHIIDRELFHVLSVHLTPEQRNSIMDKIDKAVEVAYDAGHKDGFMELSDQLPKGSVVI